MTIRAGLIALGSCGLLLTACAKPDAALRCQGESSSSALRAFKPVFTGSRASTGELTATACGMRNPAACTELELVWAPGFKRAVQAFSGQAKTAVLGAGEWPLWDVVLRTLRGPPDDPLRLADGSYLFTACMAHSCTEKGAIVLTESGSIVLAATLTNDELNKDDFSVPRGPHYSRLDIFLAEPAPANPAWRRPIRAWAKAAYAETCDADYEIFETRSIGMTEFHWLVSPESRTLTRLAAGSNGWVFGHDCDPGSLFSPFACGNAREGL